MKTLDLTFRCIVTDEQHAAIVDKQEHGEFGTAEAQMVIDRAHDSSLIKVGDENA